MKLSRKWLNEFVDLPLSEIDDRAFDEAMTVSGSKVEVTEDLSERMKNVKVGRILSLDKHPNSDHMLVAQLDVGEEEPVQICTGAWNVHVGDLVPAALHNALLPGGVKIMKGKLRGVLSNGMLCSLKELDVTEQPGQALHFRRHQGGRPHLRQGDRGESPLCGKRRREPVEAAP